MTESDIEELLGSLTALQVVVVALMNTHPNKRRLLETLAHRADGLVATMATSMIPDRTRAATRDELARLQEHLERHIADERR